MEVPAGVNTAVSQKHQHNKMYQVKFPLCLSTTPSRSIGSEDINLLALLISISCEFIHWGKSPQYPLDKRLDRFRTSLTKMSLSLTGMELPSSILKVVTLVGEMLSRADQLVINLHYHFPEL